MFNVLAREMIYKIQFLLKCAWNRKGKETENKIFYLVITDLRKVFAARKSGRERERGVVAAHRCYVPVLCNYLLKLNTVNSVKC